MSEIKTNLHLEIAHILFIDVVGYSKLLLNEQSELIQKLNEIVLQTPQVRDADAANQLIRLATGDGAALVFRNHPEAPAECALEIAAALKSHPEIQVRMGVHSGPVSEISDVNQRANLAGAGMNMAQRVMDCGDAGHILVSKRAADDLAQDRNWQPLLHDLGEVEVKHGVKILLANLYTDDLGNPAPPQKIRGAKQASRGRWTNRAAIAVLAAFALGAVLWWTLNQTKRAPDIVPATSAVSTAAISAKSIAVLPLENLSDEKENAFFADGIQDDVLTSLAKIKDLKVISRTSVMSYRDKAARNLKQIGKELGVANVLEGSVRRVGNRVLINVQLIDTATDQHIWAERYDRTLADSITLQGELASEIAGALRATLSPEEKARVESKPTDNPDAYVAYLRGREAQLRPEVSRENYLSAENFYKQAIALDPKFVLARARLSYVQSWFYVLLEANIARLAEARANAEEAVRLDANSAEAHLALAKWAQVTEDKATAQREAAAAVRLLPNDSSVAMATAMIHQTLGADEEAVAAYKRAAELGPREPKIFYNWATLLNGLGREIEARSAIDHALALAPESVYFRIFRAGAEISWTGDIGQARAILAALPSGRDPDGRVTAAHCTLAVLERNFPEALSLIQGYPSDTLPGATSHGFGTPEPKASAEGLIRTYAGDAARARECYESVRWWYESAVKDDPQSAYNHANLAFVYALLGWKAPALAEATRVTELEVSKGTPPKQRLFLSQAQNYGWAGEPDLAFQMLEQFFALPPSGYTIHNFRLDPAWDPLRNDPRFKKLLEMKKL